MSLSFSLLAAGVGDSCGAGGVGRGSSAAADETSVVLVEVGRGDGSRLSFAPVAASGAHPRSIHGKFFFSFFFSVALYYARALIVVLDT